MVEQLWHKRFQYQQELLFRYLYYNKILFFFNNQCILDGTISVRGVHMPNRKDINDPIIEELEKYGLMCVETEE